MLLYLDDEDLVRIYSSVANNYWKLKDVYGNEYTTVKEYKKLKQKLHKEIAYLFSSELA